MPPPNRPPVSLAAAAVVLASLPALALQPAEPEAPPTPNEVLAASRADEWRSPAVEDTLYLELETGRVVIELAPYFAPKHAQRMRELARSGFYDGLAFYRVADGFVAQAGAGGDEAGEDDPPLPPPLPAELERPIEATLPFTPLGAADGYAAEVGYSRGFPSARDSADGATWLVHCPGTVAMARGEDPDSGGTEFYVVLGHAPRYLDRNLSVFGRVLDGMEHLQKLPRGAAGFGMIEDPAARGVIRSLAVAADVPEGKRSRLEALSTESDSFRKLIAARRNRSQAFFVRRPDHIDVCGVPIPVRPMADATEAVDP